MIATLFLMAMMVWVIFEDFRSQTIPDAVSAGLIAYAFTAGLLGQGLSIYEACLGLIIGGGLMFLLSVVSTMGGGDVKLMGALGMWFGFKVVDVFFLSFIVGAFLALFYYIKKRNRKEKIPFGPAIAVAVLLQWFIRFPVIIYAAF